ncbi:hypothetical protein BDW22DRAFT_1433674 [Trametopsis cervina]|nr:hypothetical protein BDW22DRAFT_1433674 [Trametopsis cervina]
MSTIIYLYHRHQLLSSHRLFIVVMARSTCTRGRRYRSLLYSVSASDLDLDSPTTFWNPNISGRRSWILFFAFIYSTVYCQHALLVTVLALWILSLANSCSAPLSSSLWTFADLMHAAADPRLPERNWGHPCDWNISYLGFTYWMPSFVWCSFCADMDTFKWSQLSSPRSYIDCILSTLVNDTGLSLYSTNALAIIPSFIFGFGQSSLTFNNLTLASQP